MQPQQERTADIKNNEQNKNSSIVVIMPYLRKLRTTPYSVIMMLLCLIGVITCTDAVETGLSSIRDKTNFQVFALFPFTKNISWTEDSSLSKVDPSIEPDSPGFSHMASYLMAVEHFNNRNPVVVSELANLGDCQVRLNITGGVWDTESSSSSAVAMLMKQIYNRQIPDIVIGGYHELPVNDLSVVTSGLRIPYIAYGSSSQRVVTPFFHPFSTRTSADKLELADNVLRYLFYWGRTNFISIFHASSDASTQLENAMASTMKDASVTFFTKSYVPPILRGDQEDIPKGVASLKQMGFRTIVLLVDEPVVELPMIAQAVEDMGMHDGSYFWVIAGTFDMHFFRNVELVSDPITAKLLKGAAVVGALDGFMFDQGDKFLSAWKSLNESFITLVNENNPIQQGAPGYMFAGEDFFQTTFPGHGSSFVYDAVIAAGIGCCLADSPEEAIKAIRSNDFVGATGKVRFGSDPMYPGGRSRGTLTFGAFNLLPPDGAAAFMLTDLHQPGARTEWQSRAPFFFADGSRSPPVKLRTTPEQNYLSSGVRIAGFCLFGINVVLVLSSLIWIALYRKHSVVVAAQPFFLVMLAIGSFLIAICTFTNSWDESYGWTEEQLGRACTSTPWFATFGVILVYSSLFSKLWRINKVLSFRRTAVKPQHVIWPAILLLLCAIAMLSAWTVVEGFDWVRIEIEPLTGESIGKCQGQHTKAWFTPIFFLVVIPALLTFYMAYKTRDVDSAYSESNWIFILILIQFQMLLVSIPVLHILEMNSSTGRYIGQTLLFWTFSATPILLIIAPKAWTVHFTNSKQENRVRGRRGSVTVSGIPAMPSELSSSSPFRAGASESKHFSTDRINDSTTAVNKMNAVLEDISSNGLHLSDKRVSRRGTN